MKHDTKVLSKCFDVAGKGGNVLTDLIRESVRAKHENISFTDTEMEQREAFTEVREAAEKSKAVHHLHSKGKSVK